MKKRLRRRQRSRHAETAVVQKRLWCAHTLAKRRGTVEGCNEVDAPGPEGGRAGDGDEAEVADDRGRRPGTKWRKGQSHLECPISWQFISPTGGNERQ